MCQLDSFKALGSIGPKGKNIRITTCLNHAIVCIENFLAFGNSSEESPEKEGQACSLDSVFCIWKVFWWIYHSGSDCRREECTPDGLWNSAQGTSAAPLQGPEPWKLSVARPGDLSKIALICSEGVRGKRWKLKNWE